MLLIGLLLTNVAIWSEGAEVRYLYNNAYTALFDNAQGQFSKGWVDVDGLLRQGMKGGRISQNQDTTVDVGFGFTSPLTWGAPLHNITVGTNGVCYVPGTQLNNGFPTKNYFAPLSGDFDYSQSSWEIIYVTDGTTFTVEWRNMTVRQAGIFTFQLSISNKNNGTFLTLFKTAPSNFNSTTYNVDQQPTGQIPTFNATLFTKSTGRKIYIASINYALVDPNSGKTVSNYSAVPITTEPIYSQMGIEDYWFINKDTAQYTLDAVTSQQYTLAANTTMPTTTKSASRSIVGLFAVLICLSFSL